MRGIFRCPECGEVIQTINCRSCELKELNDQYLSVGPSESNGVGSESGIRTLFTKEFCEQAPKCGNQGVALQRSLFLGYLTGRQGVEVCDSIGSPCDLVREA